MTDNKYLHPYFVWGLLAVLTIIFGFVYNFVIAYSPVNMFEGLWAIFTSPSILTRDYIMVTGGLGPALVNSGLAGLMVVAAFILSKSKTTGIQMGAFGLVMGFAFFGKNPLNMFTIMLGAYLYAKYRKVGWGTTVNLSAFSTCLAPVVSMAAFGGIFESQGLGMAVGAILGLAIGFFINSMGVFIRKSHEGLNLYNVGWGAGLISIAIYAVYGALGLGGWFSGWSARWPGPMVSYGHNSILVIYLVGIAIYFLIFGFMAKGGFNALEIINMKADDNDFYIKYGAGHTYFAMGLLGILGLVIMLIVGAMGGTLTAPILGAIISMIGWGGFGKSVANASAIIAGVLIAGVIRDVSRGEGFYFTDSVVFTSAFWGTCLSPMAKFFGWFWALPIGMLHFAFAATIASFHGGMNLYNNGLAAGFVCVVMIPLIRAINRSGKYEPKTA